MNYYFFYPIAELFEPLLPLIQSPCFIIIQRTFVFTSQLHDFKQIQAKFM